jgi:predicted CXXCH cytochrome family protein
MIANYILIFIIVLVTLMTGSKPAIIMKQKDCLSCHSGLIKNTVVHPDLATTCDICHTSLGEEHPKAGFKGFSLSEKLPILCFNCHSDIQANFDTLSLVHGPLGDTVSCINCHNPHSSAENRLLKYSAGKLCLTCHNKTIRTDSSVIANIGQTISRAKSVHSPVESGECTTCHHPHFSETKLLLTGNFPDSQYVKSEIGRFDLCFMCHDADLFSARETETGTNFRNGNANLHFIHVNSGKGRNCNMCHDVHAAQNLKLIRDKVKFGSWEMSIRFTWDEDGGSCLTACHSEKKYNRKAN